MISRPERLVPARADNVAPSRPRRVRWAFLAAAGFLIVPLVYIAAVLTPSGQRLEDATLRGVRGTDLFRSDTALDVISIPVILVLVAVVVVVGLVRRRLGAGVGAGIVVLASAATSTLIKAIAQRPDIADSTTSNSFPSGHATIALAALFAVLTVTPRLLRPIIVIVGGAYVVFVAEQTVVYGWHRVSDILGACGVALFWLGIVRACGARVDGTGRLDREPPYRVRAVITWLLGAFIGVAAIAAAVAIIIAIMNRHADSTHTALFVAARASASAAALLAIGAVWFTDRLPHSRGA